MVVAPGGPGRQTEEGWEGGRCMRAWLGSQLNQARWLGGQGGRGGHSRRCTDGRRTTSRVQWCSFPTSGTWWAGLHKEDGGRQRQQQQSNFAVAARMAAAAAAGGSGAGGLAHSRPHRLKHSPLSATNSDQYQSLQSAQPPRHRSSSTRVSSSSTLLDRTLLDRLRSLRAIVSL